MQFSPLWIMYIPDSPGNSFMFWSLFLFPNPHFPIYPYPTKYNNKDWKQRIDSFLRGWTATVRQFQVELLMEVLQFYRALLLKYEALKPLSLFLLRIGCFCSEELMFSILAFLNSTVFFFMVTLVFSCRFRALGSRWGSPAASVSGLRFMSPDLRLSV